MMADVRISNSTTFGTTVQRTKRSTNGHSWWCWGDFCGQVSSSPKSLQLLSPLVDKNIAFLIACSCFL